MRVIGGIHRSRLLTEVPSDDTRETKDRVKESIFNSIQFDLPDAIVLDLFAGSGSLGIEALSRGAKHCDFNDQSRIATKVIQANVANLQLGNNSSITSQDALAFLQRKQSAYDIILLDPPYHMDILANVIEIIATQSLLAPYGIIIALSAREHIIPLPDCGIIEYKTKKSGITKISYLKWGQ